MIYFALIKGMVKIGCTSDMWHRIRKLKYETGEKPKILGVMDGDRKAEAAMHKRFKEHLIQGREWFSACDEIMQFIAANTQVYETDYLAPKESKPPKLRQPHEPKPAKKEMRLAVLLSRFTNENKATWSRQRALVEYGCLARMEAIPALENFARTNGNRELVGWAKWMIETILKHPNRP